jgi:hypothetical protein
MGLAAEEDRTAATQIGLVPRAAALGRGGDDTAPCAAAPLDRRRSRRRGHGHREHGAQARADHGRVRDVGASIGHHDAGQSRGVGRAYDGAEVAGFLHALDDEQRPVGGEGDISEGT